MDIDLLAKMVEELILDNDEVSLPGVGTFVAELIPATFSDKGFTINPPYRKLSFRQRESDANLLVDFYAKANSLDTEDARRILTKFLEEMKEVLKMKKYIIFPGLGKLRATKENFFFFVPDENLNIYPEGFGLEPVSLKSHEEIEDVKLAAEVLASEVAEAEAVPEPAVAEEPAPAPAIAEEPTVVEEPVPEPAVVEVPAPEPPAACGCDAYELEENRYEHHRAKLPAFVKIIIVLAILAVVFFASLAILGRLAPEIVDKLLYSPEELQILYK